MEIATNEIPSEELAAILERQNSRPLSDFKVKKLKLDAAKNWDLFYKRNSIKFFKDRHWSTREFQDLVDVGESSHKRVLLEVGCGVGNFLFPLLEENFNIYYYGCDFSPRAINLAKENPLYNEDHVKLFVNDITKDSLICTIDKESVDISTLIFVLSAIPFEKMADAVQNIFTVLKKGGVVLVRDYGLHDMAQLRFGPGNKIADCSYVRQDGTLTYFFSLATLKKLFESNGFCTVANEYVHRMTVNVKEGIEAPRNFIQAKFMKI